MLFQAGRESVGTMRQLSKSTGGKAAEAMCLQPQGSSNHEVGGGCTLLLPESQLGSRRKSNILRSSRVEMGTLPSTASDLVKVLEDSLENWYPKYPSAARCKDFIELRESLVLMRVQSLLTERVKAGKDTPLRWLDLCCGHGSIMGHFKSALQSRCSQIEYLGLDIEKKYIDSCEKKADELDLASDLADIKFRVRDIRTPLSKSIGQFDLVTFLNVFHEIRPEDLFNAIHNAIVRCKRNGCVLIIDMSILPHLEWNAITWKAQYIEELFRIFLKLDSEQQSAVCWKGISSSIFDRKIPVAVVELPKSFVDKKPFQTPSGVRGLRQRFNDVLNSLLLRMLNDVAKEIEGIEKSVYRVDPLSGKDSAQLTKTGLVFLPQHIWQHYALSRAVSSLGVAENAGE